MVCEVRDLLGDFGSYWEKAAGLAATEREAPWRDLYESLHPDVFDHYFDAWGSREELLQPALGKHDGDVLRRRGVQLRAVVEPSAARASEVLGGGDVAYFIGHKVTLELSARYPLAELVRWPATRAREEIRGVLESSPARPQS